MVTGLNTNVRYRGTAYHVQTEASGRSTPRIVSHLFHHGTILASERSEYGDLLEDEPADTALAAEVRARMESQHKAFLDRLHRGDLDASIRERLGPEALSGPARAGRAAEVTSPVPPAPKEEVAPAESPEPPPEARPRAFGGDVVDEKPLDELILEYLVEKARGRGEGGGSRRGRKKES